MEKYNDFKLNLDIFGGFITAPDIRYFESGKSKCTFAIPLKKDKDSNPIWLNCECWGKLAEKVGELEKGTEVLVFGYLKEVEYENKDREKKTKIIFIAKGVL